MSGGPLATPPGDRMLRAFGGRLSLRVHHRAAAVGAATAAVAVVTGIVSIRFGDPPVGVGTTLAVLAGRADAADAFILVELALPRLVTALLTGAALGISGAIFQSLTRNPLGSPDILGFNTGAATGAIVAILHLPWWRNGTGPLAVTAGLVTALGVYLLAWKRGMRGYRLVLVGIAVTAALQAVNTYLLARAGLYGAQSAHIWLYGSLNARSWEHAGLIAATLAVLLGAIGGLAGRLALLEMGDETARALGVPVERTRLALVALGTALAATAATVAGPIAFVALAAPQLARRLTLSHGPNLLPAGCVGALLLVAADFLAQRAVPGSNLPVGLATGVLGGLYLAWLLAHESRARRPPMS